MNELRPHLLLLAAVAAVSILGCGNRTPPVGSAEDEASEKPLLTVTPEAVKALNQVLKDQSVSEDWYLRVRGVAGGCSGFMHKLDIDTEPPSADDYAFESAGIRVVVQKNQIEMFRGAQIDYGREGGKTGFMVKNPNFEGEALKRCLPAPNADVPPSPKADAAQLSGRIAQFQKMAKDDPENELGHFRLGQLLMEDAQHAEAVKSFERTLELSPDFSKVYQLLGQCLVELGQKDRAITVLTNGWRIADRKGDETVRTAITDLLSKLGAAVPLGVPGGKGNK